MKILCDRKRPPKKKLVIVGTCYMCDSKLICEQAVDAWSAELERRTINSIGINDGNYRIWLNDEEVK